MHYLRKLRKLFRSIYVSRIAVFNLFVFVSPAVNADTFPHKEKFTNQLSIQLGKNSPQELLCNKESNFLFIINQDIRLQIAGNTYIDYLREVKQVKVAFSNHTSSQRV